MHPSPTSTPSVPPLVALIGVRSRVQELSGRLKTCLQGLQGLAEEDGISLSDATPDTRGLQPGAKGLLKAHEQHGQEQLPGHAVAWVEVSPTLDATHLPADPASSLQQIERSSNHSVVNPLFRPAPGSGNSSVASEPFAGISAVTRQVEHAAYAKPPGLNGNGSRGNGLGASGSRQSNSAGSSCSDFEQQLLRSEQRATGPSAGERTVSSTADHSPLQASPGSTYTLELDDHGAASSDQPGPRGWSLQPTGCSGYAVAVGPTAASASAVPATATMVASQPSPRGWSLQPTQGSSYAVAVGAAAVPSSTPAADVSQPSPRGWSLQPAQGSSNAVNAASPSLPSEPAAASAHGWSLQAGTGHSYAVSVSKTAPSDVDVPAAPASPASAAAHAEPKARGWGLQAAAGHSYALSVGPSAPQQDAAQTPPVQEAGSQPSPHGWNLQPSGGHSYAVSVGTAVVKPALSSAAAPAPAAQPSPRGWSLQAATGSSYAVSVGPAALALPEQKPPLVISFGIGAAAVAAPVCFGLDAVSASSSPAVQQAPIRFGVVGVAATSPTPLSAPPIRFGIDNTAAAPPMQTPSLAVAAAPSPLPTPLPQQPIRFGADGALAASPLPSSDQPPIQFGINGVAAPAVSQSPTFRFGVNAASVPPSGPPAALPTPTPAVALSPATASRGFGNAGLDPNLLPPAREITKSSRSTIDPSMLSPQPSTEGRSRQGSRAQGSAHEDSYSDDYNSDSDSEPNGAASAFAPASQAAVDSPSSQRRQLQHQRSRIGGGISTPRSRQLMASGSSGSSPMRSPSIRRTQSSALGSPAPSSGSPQPRLQLGKVVPTVRQLVMEDMARKGLDQVVTSVGKHRRSSAASSAGGSGISSPRLAAAGSGAGTAGQAGSSSVGGASALVQDVPCEGSGSSKNDGVVHRVLMRMGVSEPGLAGADSEESEGEDVGESDRDEAEDEEGVQSVVVAARSARAAVALVPGLDEEGVRVRKSLLLLRDKSACKRSQSTPSAMLQQQQQQQQHTGQSGQHASAPAFAQMDAAARAASGLMQAAAAPESSRRTTTSLPNAAVPLNHEAEPGHSAAATQVDQLPLPALILPGQANMVQRPPECPISAVAAMAPRAVAASRGGAAAAFAAPGSQPILQPHPPKPLVAQPVVAAKAGDSSTLTARAFFQPPTAGSKPRVQSPSDAAATPPTRLARDFFQRAAIPEAAPTVECAVQPSRSPDPAPARSYVPPGSGGGVQRQGDDTAPLPPLPTRLLLARMLRSLATPRRSAGAPAAPRIPSLHAHRLQLQAASEAGIGAAAAAADVQLGPAGSQVQAWPSPGQQRAEVCSPQQSQPSPPRPSPQSTDVGVQMPSRHVSVRGHGTAKEIGTSPRTCSSLAGPQTDVEFDPELADALFDESLQLLAGLLEGAAAAAQPRTALAPEQSAATWTALDCHAPYPPVQGSPPTWGGSSSVGSSSQAGGQLPGNSVFLQSPRWVAGPVHVGSPSRHASAEASAKQHLHLPPTAYPDIVPHHLYPQDLAAMSPNMPLATGNWGAVGPCTASSLAQPLPLKSSFQVSGSQSWPPADSPSTGGLCIKQAHVPDVPADRYLEALEQQLLALLSRLQAGAGPAGGADGVDRNPEPASGQEPLDAGAAALAASLVQQVAWYRSQAHTRSTSSLGGAAHSQAEAAPPHGVMPQSHRGTQGDRQNQQPNHVPVASTSEAQAHHHGQYLISQGGLGAPWYLAQHGGSNPHFAGQAQAQVPAGLVPSQPSPVDEAYLISQGGALGPWWLSRDQAWVPASEASQAQEATASGRMQRSTASPSGSPSRALSAMPTPRQVALQRLLEGLQDRHRLQLQQGLQSQPQVLHQVQQRLDGVAEHQGSAAGGLVSDAEASAQEFSSSLPGNAAPSTWGATLPAEHALPLSQGGAALPWQALAPPSHASGATAPPSSAGSPAISAGPAVGRGVSRTGPGAAHAETAALPAGVRMGWSQGGVPWTPASVLGLGSSTETSQGLPYSTAQHQRQAPTLPSANGAIRAQVDAPVFASEDATDASLPAYGSPGRVQQLTARFAHASSPGDSPAKLSLAGQAPNGHVAALVHSWGSPRSDTLTSRQTAPAAGSSTGAAVVPSTATQTGLGAADAAGRSTGLSGLTSGCEGLQGQAGQGGSEGGSNEPGSPPVEEVGATDSYTALLEEEEEGEAGLARGWMQMMQVAQADAESGHQRGAFSQERQQGSDMGAGLPAALRAVLLQLAGSIPCAAGPTCSQSGASLSHPHSDSTGSADGGLAGLSAAILQGLQTTTSTLQDTPARPVSGSPLQSAVAAVAAAVSPEVHTVYEALPSQRDEQRAPSPKLDLLTRLQQVLQDPGYPQDDTLASAAGDTHIPEHHKSLAAATDVAPLRRSTVSIAGLAASTLRAASAAGQGEAADMIVAPANSVPAAVHHPSPATQATDTSAGVIVSAGSVRGSGVGGNEYDETLAPLREALLSACAAWQQQRGMRRKSQQLAATASQGVKARPAGAGSAAGVNRVAHVAAVDPNLLVGEQGTLRLAFQRWRSLSALRSRQAHKKHQQQQHQAFAIAKPVTRPAGTSPRDVKSPVRPFLSYPGEQAAASRLAASTTGSGLAQVVAALSPRSPRTATRLSVSVGGKLRHSEQALAQELLQQLVALGLGPAGPAPTRPSPAAVGGVSPRAKELLPTNVAAVGSGATKAAGLGQALLPSPGKVRRQPIKSASPASAVANTRLGTGAVRTASAGASLVPARAFHSVASADGPMNIQPTPVRATSHVSPANAHITASPTNVSAGRSKLGGSVGSPSVSKALLHNSPVSPGFASYLQMAKLPAGHQSGVARPLDLAFYGVQDAVDTVRPAM